MAPGPAGPARASRSSACASASWTRPNRSSRSSESLGSAELHRRADRAVAALAECRAGPRDCGVNRLEDKWAACKNYDISQAIRPGGSAARQGPEGHRPEAIAAMMLELQGRIATTSTSSPRSTWCRSTIRRARRIAG